jgi:hypothetical protein
MNRKDSERGSNRLGDKEAVMRENSEIGKRVLSLRCRW